MAKTLYHGALADMGPVTVTVKQERTKSKFSKPAAPKPDYVVLALGGEDYGYNTENEACAEFFKGRKGQTITVQAEGRGAEAKITCVGAPGSQLAPRTVAPPPAATKPEPAANRSPAPHDTSTPAGGEVLLQLKHFVARNRVLCVVALEAAWHTKREFEAAKNWEMPDSTFTAVYTSMLYGAAAAGYKGEQQGLPLDAKFKPEAK